jgi:nucleotide-binding universal stress UspA family protein
MRKSQSNPAQSPDYTVPLLDSILLASDFSAVSVTAFHHALRAALIANCKLTILHVSPEAAEAWTDFPGVREVLERWGLIPPGSPKSAVPQLGIDVRKVIARDHNPVTSVLHFLENHPANLIVLATYTKEDRASWLHHSPAEPVARKAGQMTLFISDTSAGFVSASDGSVSLGRILIPIAAKPQAQPALSAAARLVERLKLPKGTFILLHVGEEDSMPAAQPLDVPGWDWKTVTCSGDVIQGILSTAKKESADLIVMATDGRNGFLDALRGSHSERVLRGAPCPLLTVPEGSLAGGALT